ncbi:MFS transporter [Falsiroseomonas bella]|uniref:MFS transporter n=1 Tax=Falsiroseomonas bella TaxID=2184016 RepID=A0A317FGE3_9PROT|nr:MFS transporter [Falsiroseomonas bella]PWS38131.1 MFS transporter [Falsiroseomonas bella]
MPLLALAYLAFIGLGLPDPLPGALWPEVAPAYGLPNAGLGLLLAGLSVGYILAGLLAGRIIAALGIGGVLAASVGATALAAFGQALAPPFGLFVTLAVLAGAGGGAVDAALNAWSARHLAPRHLNWLHACWGIGATLGPAAAAALLAAGAGWQAVYATAGALLAALAGGFVLTRRRWDDTPPPEAPPRHGTIAALRSPVARLQMAVFFVYTGLEAGAGQWAATILTARGATPAEGAAAATLFFAALAGARIGMGFVVDRIGPDRLLRLAVPPTAVAALLLAFGGADLLALVLLATLLAPVYPTVMARTPARLGPLATHAFGLQVAAAMAGVAVLPGLMGLAADAFGAAAVPWLLVGLSVLLAWLVLRLPEPRAASATG